MDEQDKKGNTPLHIAIAKKNITMVQFLIQNGAKLNIKNQEKKTALELAAEDRKILEEVLDMKEVDVDETASKGGLTLLYKSLIKENFSLAKFLLDKGADINYFHKGKPLISHFIDDLGRFDQDLEVLQFFISHADLSLPDSKGNCPLHHAITAPLETVKMLLDADIPLNSRNHKGQTPFMWIFDESNIQIHDKNIELFIERSQSLEPDELEYISKRIIDFSSMIRPFFEKFVFSKLTEKEKESNPAASLHFALFNHHVEEVQNWLKMNPNPQNLDFYGIPALHAILYYAPEKAHELVPLLIGPTKDLNAEDPAGSYPLTLVLRYQKKVNASVTELLLKGGADIDMPYGSRSKYSYFFSKLSFLKLLKERNYDFSGERGTLALEEALLSSDQERINYLFDIGAAKLDTVLRGAINASIIRGNKQALARLMNFPHFDVNKAACFEKTPLLLAIEKDDLKIFELLLLAEHLNPDFSGDHNKSLLHCIASSVNVSHQIEFAHALLSRGAKIDYLNNDRETPLHVALQNKNFALAKFLIANGAGIHLKHRMGESPLDIAKINQYQDIVDLMANK